MKEETEQKLNALIEKLDKLLDEKNGIRVSGNGMISNNTDKANEILDKIQKFLYFMEARQMKMLKVMGKNAGMSDEEISNLEKQKF
jgi:hypothetical protein